MTKDGDQPSMNQSPGVDDNQAEQNAEPTGNAPPPPSPEPVQDDTEEQEECGWCRWMKGGGCREPFVAWQKCIDDMTGTGNEVTECSHWMGPLFQCMLEHKEYYEPQLKAFLDADDDQSDPKEASNVVHEQTSDQKEGAPEHGHDHSSIPDEPKQEPE